MSIFTWFSDLFGFDSAPEPPANDPHSWSQGPGLHDLSNPNPLDEHAINPANGLPMVGGTGGVDVEGNPYGTDFSHDHFHSPASSDPWSSGSGGSFPD